MSIPNFYIEIHNLFMKFFENGPECISDILNELLWLNDNIIVNKIFLYLTSWENNAISQVRDILNENGEFLTHEEIVKTKIQYHNNLSPNYRSTKSIPTSWIHKN